MNRTVLVTVSDDRFGRKDSSYGVTQDKIVNIFKNNADFGIYEFKTWKYEDIIAHPFYEHCKDFKVLMDNTDAGRNGRVYKPFVINEAFKHINYGDFIIYTDCSPEIWNVPDDFHISSEIFDIDVLKALCLSNKGILNVFIKWSDKEIYEGQLGIHTHKNFTMKRCIDAMGLQEYENSFMGASGMWVIYKTQATEEFLSKWLYWNLNPLCSALGDPKVKDDYSWWNEECMDKMGHRHDQSISGLLLNQMDHKLVDILYNDLAPYNFLQFARKGVEYVFIDSNSPLDANIKKSIVDSDIQVDDTVWNIKGTELKVFEIRTRNNENWYIVGKNKESCYGTWRNCLLTKKP